VREKDVSITLKLPGGLEETTETTCQTLLTAMMVYFTDLREEYPDNIIVYDMEV
jgi:hypothetical protein